MNEEQFWGRPLMPDDLRGLTVYEKAAKYYCNIMKLPPHDGFLKDLAETFKIHEARVEAFELAKRGG